MTELVAGAAGGPALASLLGPERLWLGSLLHRLYQERARAEDPTFEAELPLALELEHEGRAIHLHGRADGVREAADGAFVVEELKSVGPSEPREERLAQEALQVSLYAWMLARARGRPVRTRLLRLAGDADAGVRIAAEEDLPFEPAETEARARELLAARLAEERRRAALRAARARLGGALRFPFAAERAGQREIGSAVERALAEGRHLLLEAPTGLGKTAAVLLPALRFAFREGARVFFLTSRGSQQRGVLGALARMAPEGAATAVALRAKADLCATGTLLCHEDHCRFARDYVRRRAPALVDAILASAPVLGPEAVRAAGLAHALCPHALAADLARDAALTVADQNYALDPFAALPELGPRAPLHDVVLVLDEAHQVPERARAAGSAGLSLAALRGLEAAAAAGGAPVHAAVRRAAGALASRLAAVAADAAGGDVAGDGEVEWELAADDFADERDALERAAAAYLDYRIGTRSLDAADPLVEGVLAARRFFEALEGAGPGFARSVAFAGGVPSLRLHCLEPERRLARLFARCRAVVAVSATLRPFEARRALLGLDEDRTDALALPSPFPPARRAVVIDPRADTRLRTRAREAPRLARRLAAFASAVPGAVLVLAPSFAWLEAVRAALPPLDRPVLAQRADDGARERERLLTALAAPAEPPVLLLAVAGGFFGEGVDWPGALAGVAVLGPCLPPPDLPRELLRRAYDDRFGTGFDLAYALPGMTRVVQGAGRLIRSERDRGVIALFGRRFLEPPYRELLPSEWLGGGTPEDLVGDPARVARGFFAQPG